MDEWFEVITTIIFYYPNVSSLITFKRKNIKNFILVHYATNSHPNQIKSIIANNDSSIPRPETDPVTLCMIAIYYFPIKQRLANQVRLYCGQGTCINNEVIHHSLKHQYIIYLNRGTWRWCQFVTVVANIQTILSKKIHHFFWPKSQSMLLTISSTWRDYTF